MKNKLTKFAQAATLGLALALTFSCSSDGGDSYIDGSLGDNLTLSGQVYTTELDYSAKNIKYVPYTGNKTLTSNTGETGSINKGIMSFSAGIPSESVLDSFEDSNDDDDEFFYPDATVQPSDTRGTGLDFLGIDLEKTNANVNATANSLTMQAVIYLYVDKDCAITAKGGSFYDEEGIKVTYSNLNLKLKKGWNVANMKVDYNYKEGSEKGSMAMNTGDLSNAKWVLGGYNFNNSRKSLARLVKISKAGIQQSINANK